MNGCVGGVSGFGVLRGSCRRREVAQANQLLGKRLNGYSVTQQHSQVRAGLLRCCKLRPEVKQLGSSDHWEVGDMQCGANPKINRRQAPYYVSYIFSLFRLVILATGTGLDCGTQLHIGEHFFPSPCLTTARDSGEKKRRRQHHHHKPPPPILTRLRTSVSAVDQRPRQHPRRLGGAIGPAVFFLVEKKKIRPQQFQRP